MNAKCRIIQELPNWEMVQSKKIRKKKKYIQDKLYLYLTDIFDEMYLSVFYSNV